MPVPRLRRALEQLDGGRPAERARTMALLGRDNAGDPALGELLDELSGQSDYHHQLALVAAATAGDASRLQAALAHPSARLRSFAFAHLARLGLPPDDIREALLAASAEDRRRLRRFVNQNRRTDLAEAVIDDVRRELGDREAGSLLATCGEETVRRLLPEVLYAVASLASLARRHPGPLFDHLEVSLRELPSHRRDLFWNDVDAAVRELAIADPGRMLRLVEDDGPSWVVPRGLHAVLGRLIRFAPSRVAGLIVDERFVRSLGRSLPAPLRRNASRFSAADRVAIARALRERNVLLFAWIERLPPSERAAVFAQALDDLDVTGRAWAPRFLEVLPHATRHAEARRVLGLRAVRASDALTLQYTAFLPFAEAREALQGQLGRARAEERAHGYGLLISCARRERSPEALAEALQLCARLQNEQDPVRLSAVQALASVPPAQVTDAHLGALRALVKAVLEARDTSPATLHQLSGLAFRLLGDAARAPGSPRFRFALDALDQLAGPTGSISFPPLDRLLPRGAETALIDALLARLGRDAARSRYQLTLSLARALRKRAWGHPGLQALLGRATRAASDSVVRSAIDLWLDDPGTRDDRVGQVVAEDESTVAVPIVLATIVRSRQDLLDPLLRDRPLKGRFLTGETRYVPIIPSGFGRWLPRQCESYRAALESLIATPGTAARSTMAAVRTLARLPEIGTIAVTPFLSSDDVPAQEAALAGLAWTDTPAHALGLLLGYAGSERARVGLYAATRCARFVPRRELAPPLAAVLQRDDAKVTSRKEVARLLGAHRPPGSLDLLLSTAVREGVHRDLRVAVGRSLRSELDDDRVWRLYGEMSSGTDDEARSLLDTVPRQVPPRHRARYAALVIDITRSASQPVRSAAFSLLGTWAPWADEAPSVTCAAIANLGAGPEWRSALSSLRVTLLDGTGWEEAGALIATLVERTDAPDFDAGAERDRPSAQRLEAVLAQVAGLPHHERGDHRSAMVHIGEILVRAAPLSHGELMISFAAVDWEEPIPALAAVAGRLDDHPMLAAPAMGALGRALEQDREAWGPGSLGDAADHLIGAGTAGAGALALRLVHTVGARFSWPEPWRARVRALRDHPAEDVAALAQGVWTASE